MKKSSDSARFPLRCWQGLGSDHGAQWGRLLIILWVLAFMWIPARSSAGTITWTNTAGGNWNASANWDPNQVPAAADGVLITNDGTYTVQIDNKTLSVASLTLGGGSGTQTLQSYTGGGGPALTLTNAAIANHGALSMYGGNGLTTLKGAIVVGAGAALSLDNTRLDHAIIEVQAGGTLTVAGAGATIYYGSRLAVRTNGTVNLNVTFSVLGPITNAGTINVNAGNIGMQNIGTANYAGGLVNEAGGAVHFKTGSSGMTGTDQSYVINRGTIYAWDAGGTVINVTRFTNSLGTVWCKAGTLNLQEFNGAGNLDGIFRADPGATIDFYAADSVVTTAGPALQCIGDGLFQFEAGILALAADQLPANLQFLNGTLVPGTLITHALGMGGGKLGGTSVAIGSGGILTLSRSGVTAPVPMEVRAGGRLDIQSALTISKTATLTVNTGGSVNMGGNITLQGPMSNFGAVTQTAGYFMIMNGTAGNIGGLINEREGVIAFNYRQAVIGWGEQGYLINRGMIVRSASADPTYQTIINVATFTNEGTLSVHKGSIRVDNTFFMQPSSILNAGLNSQTDFGKFYWAGPGAVTLGGTFSLTFNNGYVPSVGASFMVMDDITPGTYSGAFANVPPTPPIMGWGTSYTSTQFTVTNLGLCPSITATVAGDATLCAGASAVVTVTLTGGAPPYTVSLNNGGGTQTGTSPLSFTVNPSVATTYLVSSSADSNGCPALASGSATISFKPPPLAGIYAFTNYVGQPGVAGNVNGPGSAANFRLPYGVAVDGAGNVFVADQYNHIIRKVTPDRAVSTLAGSAGEWGSTDDTGSAARFKAPAGLALDHAGNLIVADYQNHTIRKVTPAGEVTTLAGSAGNAGSDDGLGSAAHFDRPVGVAVDGAGNVLVADSYNHTIRKITPAGDVTTLAGSAGNAGSANGTVGEARFHYPSGVAVDSVGNVLVVDSYNHTIRKITPAGEVTTLAGSPGLRGTSDGTGSAARLDFPSCMAVDTADSLFVSDHNSTIRKVTASGVVTTLAGSPGNYGADDGLGNQARFYMPYGVTVDSAGNLYVADSYNHRITQGTPCYVPTITTPTPLPAALAGTAYNQSLGAFGGLLPYAWTRASGSLPADLSLSIEGVISGTPLAAGSATFTVQVTDSCGRSSTQDFSLTISPVPPTITTPNPLPSSTVGTAYSQPLAASNGSPPYTWTLAAGALPVNLELSTNGVICGTPLAVGTNTFTVRVTDSAGQSSTKVFSLAVNPAPPIVVYAFTNFAGLPETSGNADGTGSEARFDTPLSTAVDSAGNVFVADYYNHTIRKVTPAGVVTTLAGSPGVPGTNDGAGNAARFYVPYHLAVDDAGNVFVGDHGNFTIRKVTPAGVVTTLAGYPHVGGTNDGVGSAARFGQMCGVAVDSEGNVFVGDTEYSTIRKITPAGVVTTLAGSPGIIGPNDGTGSEARFHSPSGVVVDPAGNVLVADSWNHAIRKVTPTGVVTTVGGSPGHVGSADGVGTAARFYHPKGVALDAAGNLYVADAINHRVTKGTPYTLAPNHPPVLNPIASTNVDELSPLSFQVTAYDPDPTDTLTFTLIHPPSGAAIDANTGLFTWTPSESEGPSNFVVQVVVSDNGTPSLSATQSFVLTAFSPDLVNVNKWLPEALADGVADWPTYANSSGAPLFTPTGVAEAWFRVYHSGWRLCLLAGDLPLDTPGGLPDHFGLLIRTDRNAGPTVTPAEYRFIIGRDGSWSAQRGTDAGTFAPISVPAGDVSVATVTNGDKWTLELLLSLEWFGGYGRYERFSLILETATGQPVVQWPDTAQADSPATWGRWILLPRYPTVTRAMGVQVPGRDGYLVVPNAAELNPAEITLEAWVQLLDETSSGTLVGNARSNSFWFGLGGRLQFTVNGEALAGSGATPVTPRCWHHVAATVTSNGLCTLYLDGQQDAQFASAPEFQLAGSDRHLRIGSDFATADDYEHLRAWIRDLRIWNCARTAAQIQGAASGTLTNVEPGLVGWWPFANGLRDMVGGHDAGRMGNACLVLTGPPTLTIAAGPPGPPVRVDWPEEFSLQGWRLLSNTNLASTNWTEFTSTASNRSWLTPAGINRVFLIPAEPPRFFRAVKP